MVTMSSKGEPTCSDTEDFSEEMHLNVEAANRLRVFYLFEGKITFTDIFRKSVLIINEDDIVWNDYIKILDNLVDTDNDDHELWNDPIWKMAESLATIHVFILNIAFSDEDLFSTIKLLHLFSNERLVKDNILKNLSKEQIRKWTHERNEWIHLI